MNDYVLTVNYLHVLQFTSAFYGATFREAEK